MPGTLKSFINDGFQMKFIKNRALMLIRKNILPAKP